MDKIIACCGIECSKCDAYTATKNNDAALKQKTAEEWSRMFNSSIEAKDINCLGCRSDTTFGYCTSCEIRKCNYEKSHENCSKCGEYSCGKLDEFFTMAPDAKTVLDSLR